MRLTRRRLAMSTLAGGRLLISGEIMNGQFKYFLITLACAMICAWLILAFVPRCSASDIYVVEGLKNIVHGQKYICVGQSDGTLQCEPETEILISYEGQMCDGWGNCVGLTHPDNPPYGPKARFFIEVTE